MTNPLFLRYSFLNSLSLDHKDSSLFKRVVSLSPFRCPLHITTSPLTRHSIRCYHLSRHYSFPSHVSTLALFHNIYGTNFLDNSRFSDFIRPNTSNRELIAHLLGKNTEYAIFEYSVLTENLLAFPHFSSLSTDILSLIFVNTIEITSSQYSFHEPLRQQKLAFYIPILYAICDLARDWPGYPHISMLLSDIDVLCSSLHSL